MSELRDAETPPDRKQKNIFMDLIEARDEPLHHQAIEGIGDQHQQRKG